MAIPAVFGDESALVVSRRKSTVRLGGILVYLAVALSVKALTWRAPPSAPGLPTLTTAEQVRELTADQAKRGYPVRLRAVVTYIDFAVGDFFVQDSTAGIYVNENNRRPSLPARRFVGN